MAEPFRLGTTLIEGSERTLIESAGQIHLLSDLTGEEASVLSLLQHWDTYRPGLGDAASAAAARQGMDEADVRFLSPITNGPKLICIGTNYHDHLREMGISDPPEFPYAFLRPHTCLAGHREDVPLPDWPEFVDWEAELGMIIGKRGRNLKGAAARDAIAGYTPINDISARDWIANRPWVGIDWVMQKGWDKFQPTGPWLTPAEFVPDPQALDIELTVNGKVEQSSNTSEMIFGIEAIVEHLSRIMTLECGDIIATGTPAGVGFGRKPPLKLNPGDEMVVRIAGLGELHNRMVQPE